MREQLGNRELWFSGVTAIVLKPAPKDAPIWVVPEVLLVQRADNKQWTPVTGIVDPGEEPHEAALREIKEETGLDASVAALLGVGKVGPVTYPNGDIAGYYDTAFRCTVDADAQPYVADDESVAVGWFPISGLPPLQPRFRLLIGDAAAEMNQPLGFQPRMGYVKREQRGR